MFAHIAASEDLTVPAEVAYERILAVETWPVWLSLVKRAELAIPRTPLTFGNDVTLASAIAPGDEEIYEVAELIEPFMIALVGAYSCRRRLEFRVERKNERSRIVVKITYPIYGGIVRDGFDRITRRRRLASELASSLITFKGLVEHDASDRLDREESLGMPFATSLTY